MDFCNESVGTKVISSHVSFDGHDVNNLTSSNSHLRSKGFIAESFVKPPVDIVFTFPCHVEISSVLLCTSVGCQKSVGIDLLSLISRNGACNNTSEGDHTSQYEEVLLAKCCLSTESKVHFVNPLFKIRPPFTVENHCSKSADTFVRNMKCTMRKPLISSGGVKLRIWKTANRSQPALSWVSIYGIPSRSVNEQVVNKLLASVKLASSAGQQKADEKTTSVKGQTSVATSSKNCIKGTEETEETIPNEFIDPLTYEIMTFPVVLPSGNTVDQITLSRHISSEQTWGRQPNDPFTGVPFSSGRQPVPNAFLKCRIDKFLLQHDNVANGRTTGTLKRPLEQEKHSMNTTNHLEANMPKKFCRSITEKPDCKERVGSNERLSNPAGTSASLGSNVNDSETLTDHEARLSQSLDLALKDTLATKTSFSSVNPSSKWHNLFHTQLECVACKIRSKGFPFYQLPCSHVMCRKCIISVNSNDSQKRCHSCGKIFFQNQLSRCHQ